MIDDLSCTVKSGTDLEFMNYWDLVHNWASISKAVKAGGQAAQTLKAPSLCNAADHPSPQMPTAREFVKSIPKHIDQSLYAVFSSCRSSTMTRCVRPSPKSQVWLTRLIRSLRTAGAISCRSFRSK